MLERKFRNEKRVKLYGSIDHLKIPEVLAKSNILVLPSYWEGSPTTIIEAMAMGVPVIASNIGDISRLLNKGKTGTLFDVGKSESLEKAILTVMKDYEYKVSIALKARKKIRSEFSFQSVTDQIEQIYYDLANR